jgi:hypothetical protein
VSASVEDDCRKLKDEICGNLHRILKQMMNEPRDTVWAGKTEGALRDRLTNMEPGKFLIRTVECRTSACAIEVQSLYGVYSGGDASYDFGKANGISLADVSHGYERGDGGAGVTVTLAAYIRR